MTTRYVTYCSSERFPCAGASHVDNGTVVNDADVILCLQSAGLVVPGTCDYPFSTIHAKICQSYNLGDSCTSARWNYTFSYDDTQLTNPSTPLVASDITGVFCEGCFTNWVEEQIGNDATLVNNGDGTYTFTNEHGCVTSFEAGQPNNSSVNDLYFGDGSDGDLTIVSPIDYVSSFPSRDLAFENLTVNAGATFRTYGQAYFSTDIPARPTPPDKLTGYWFLKVSVSDTLTINGTIDSSGYAGANGHSGSALQISPGSPAAEDGAGGGGDWGGYGGGANSTSRAGTTPRGYRDGTHGQMAGGFGGAGGSGGTDGSSSGYSGADPQADNGGAQSGYPFKFNDLMFDLVNSGGPYALGRAGIVGGGTGGGGGGAGAGGSGGGDAGGGGGGGGTIFFVANKIVLGAGSVIRARGGVGGNGGNGTGTATPPTYTLSGHVVDNVAANLAGATINAGGIGITTSDASGLFSFPGVAAGTIYTVTVTKAAYTFSSPQSGTLNSNTTLSNFVGTPVVTGYNPANYFTAGSMVAWYPCYNSTYVLNGSSPATDGQLITKLVEATASGRDALQGTALDQATCRTNIQNGYQVLEYAINDTQGYIPSNFLTILNGATSLTIGWVGALTDGSANGEFLFAYDNTYSFPRVKAFLLGNRPSANWNTVDGVDELNEQYSPIGQAILTGNTNFHAVLWVYDFVAGNVTLYIDKVVASNMNPWTHGTAQAIPNLPLNEPHIMRSFKGRTLDIFSWKNGTPTLLKVNQWFDDVKSKFSLMAY